jgi:hypothetical protein
LISLSELETIHQQNIGRSQGLTAEIVNQMVGRIAGAVVLEALAIELVLKARLDRAGVQVWREHNHFKLFEKLPEGERKQAGQRYALRRHPTLRDKLEEVLAFSADVFVECRYMHEQP